MKTVTAWIARDSDGSIHLFHQKPEKLKNKTDNSFIWHVLGCEKIRIPYYLYGISFESPYEIEIIMDKTRHLQLGEPTVYVKTYENTINEYIKI